MADEITLYHNPGCGTSRKVLQLIRDAGHEPRVVEYLKIGWREDQLTALLARLGVRARDILRVRGTAAEDLGLTAPRVADADIIAAMVRDPALVERPIVVSPKGAALCRPAETVAALL